MPLTVPLSMEQIAAANRLSSHCPQWTAVNQALHQLGQRFPGFELPSALLKVATVNQLYFTNVWAVARMAEHVAAVIAAAGPDAGAELVEQLAALPRTPNQKHARSYISFASKFAHFFVDAERFPIYDYYAGTMLAYHLGPAAMAKNTGRPYQAFVENVRRLRERAQLACTADELDAYLWLAGLYRQWCADPAAPINTEAANLFSLPSTEVQADLAALLPTSATDEPGQRLQPAATRCCMR